MKVYFSVPLVLLLQGIYAFMVSSKCAGHLTFVSVYVNFTWKKVYEHYSHSKSGIFRIIWENISLQFQTNLRTQLIKPYCKNKNNFFFTSEKEDEVINLHNFNLRKTKHHSSICIFNLSYLNFHYQETLKLPFWGTAFEKLLDTNVRTLGANGNSA